MKVSEKGAVSVYCLGRFPSRSTASSGEKLLAMAGEIKTFIAENGDRLKVTE